MYQDVLQTILDTKIIAILRGVAPDQLTPLAEVLYQGGIRCIEVTFDQKRADGVRATADAIARLSGAMRGRMYIGSGTVLTVEQAEATAAAGGTFVISPNCNQMVIRRTRELEMVSIPGAMTPTEIVQAAQWGASVVKVFPAGNLGPDYIKAVRGPLDHIPLCAVGGVDHNNLEEFHRAGVTCFGVGSNIVRKELLAAGNYAAIRENATLYTEQAETW